MKRKIYLSVGALALGIGGVIGGCNHGSATNLSEKIVPAENPVISGTSLYCDSHIVVDLNDSATQTADLYGDANKTIKQNISKDPLNPNAQNRLRSITAEAIPSTSSDGTLTGEGDVYPILVSYAEQVEGDYELGDGSADVGDPAHVDDIFVSLSRDNGQTWKKYQISDSAKKSSIQVKWDGQTIDYPGHSVKADMAVSGNNILVAWQDKYCPSGNPLGFPLSDDPDYTYVDKWDVTGAQGTVDYGGIVALPNGKTVWEVPFSCVWTARGEFNTTTNEIDWMQPQQLTSGKRDAAKIWIAAQKDAGFAITWQEDPEGLRAGNGAGPGEGWSGATTNHGSDIWYTYIDMDKFAEVNTSVESNKSVPLYNFADPVRITDNARCSDTNESKQYCADPVICQDSITAETTSDKNNGNGGNVCVTGDVDALGTYYPGNFAVLDGDTGASRPAMKLLKTNTGQVIAYLAYEETKGLSDSNTADQGSTDTNISAEGKSVYVEMFPFDKPVTVSSGNIVNTPVDGYYQNARRVVLVNQVDACEAENYTVGILYKEGNETRGGSSDMFVRLSTGLNPDLSSSVWSQPVNVSSNTATLDENNTVIPNWTEGDLHDLATVNTDENTFSPRGFMRGDNVFIGFEYTPNWAKTEQGNVPNNFYIHRKLAGNIDAFTGWQGPQNITKISGQKISTLDPAFLPTPAAVAGSPIPEYQVSAAGVLFMAYGTFDMTTGEEINIYYTRSTDGGATWSYYVNDNNVTVNSTISAVQDVIEKEVQAMSVPNGSKLYTAWMQESHEYNSSDHFTGLDSWFGETDFNETK